MIEYYGLIKHLHVSCVTASLLLFLLRGYWAIVDSPQRQQRWIKIVPHVIDTLLLGAGITLAILIQQYPFVDAWLTAKVLALIAYILFGALTLRATSQCKRTQAYLIAITLFAYIVGVAVTKNPYLAFL